ncbi:hypothetical protein [Amedibacillus dolichus]|uniref:hypothetical protein n=1 Tax=Amedibacillus dolichus TaxID=31971 RepID=UPI002943A62D|nr:hypothetical protein [Amedibacillus dolichus]
MNKHKRIVLIIIIVIFVLCTVVACHVTNPRYMDLRRFVDPIHENKTGAKVRTRDGKDVTEQFIKDTKFYYNLKLYGAIEDYIQEYDLTLSK